jgi:hypothetical protein
MADESAKPVVAEGGERTGQGEASAASEHASKGSRLDLFPPIFGNSLTGYGCAAGHMVFSGLTLDKRIPGWLCDAHRPVFLVVSPPQPPALMGEQSRSEMPDLQPPKDGPPFDQNPPAKAKAIDGYRWCNDCDSVVSAVAHSCQAAP